MIHNHINIIEHALRTGIKGIVICATGPEAEAMYLAGQPLDHLELVDSPENAIFPLKKWLKDGDFLLLKASRNVSLERLLPLLEESF